LRRSTTDLRCPLCMEAEIDKLRTALKPFAATAIAYNGFEDDALIQGGDFRLKVVHFRIAAKLLNE
jgi:hypothetical protein